MIFKINEKKQSAQNKPNLEITEGQGELNFIQPGIFNRKPNG